MDRARLGRRTPLACDECRRSKTKCSGTRPFCRRCSMRKTPCTWPWPHQPDTPDSLQSLSPRSGERVVASEAETGTAATDVVGHGRGRAPPERLLAIFLARHHDVEFCSFLHKPTTSMASLQSKAPFLAAAVASIAALYLCEDDIRRDFGTAFASAADVSFHYAQQATALARDQSGRPSVHTIQAFLIMAIRELLAWKDFRAWMHAGTAIRMAQALRLGMEIQSPNRTTPQQRETRRRTFWACFVVDRLISYACHHPFAIDLRPLPLNSQRVRLPCSENAFAFDESETGPSLDEIMARQQLHQSTALGSGYGPSRLSMAPLYVAMFSIWGDMALLHVTGGRRQMPHEPTDPAGAFFQANRAIAEFAAQLPAALHWSPENYRRHQATGQAAAFVQLNFLLQHARCVMHHEYLPQLDMQYYAPMDMDTDMDMDAAGLPPDYINKPIIDTCVSAVNTITDMAALLGEESDRSGSPVHLQSLQSTVAAHALMTAAAVHLWIVYTQTCDRCPKPVARAKFRQLLGVIQSWEEHWPVAAAWAQTLDVLYKLYEYSYGTDPVPELLFWEGEGSGGVDSEPSDPDHGLSYGGALVDPDIDVDTGARCLHDKVRSILAHPLHAPEVKKKNMRVFSQTLWQNLWNPVLFGELGEWDGQGLDMDEHFV